MLQFIRDRAQGLVAGVIVGLLALTFALWGIEQYIGAGGEVIVAEVNGDEIDLRTYQTTYQRLRQRAQAELGEQFDPAVWTESETKLKALDYLIDDALVAQVIEASRMRVTDAQVAESLRSSPLFEVDGKFSRERYAQVASMLGYTEAGLEQQARLDLVTQQLRAGVAGSAFVTRQAAERLEQLREQKRTVGWAIVPAAAPETIEIPSADVEAHYAEHEEDYREPERVQLEYLSLALDDLMAQVPADEAALRAYYEEHEGQYTVEEQRNVNHILIQVKRDATADQDAAARERAEQLRQQALEGADFEDLAREHSDDTGSRADGGETGLFGKGVMTPEFERAAFALEKPGDVSEVIRTEFGYHVLRLKAVEPGGVKPFEEARAEVEQAYRREQAETLFFERAEDFSNAVYEHPDSLAAAGEALGLEPRTTGPLTREELASEFSPALADAVWEPEVLTEGLATAPVDMGGNAVIAARVTERTPSRIPPLDEVRDTIRGQLASERARADAERRGEAILAKLRDGNARAPLIESEGLEWREAREVGRDSTEVTRAVLRAAFKAPATDGTSYVGVGLGTGDYAVIAVSDVKTPEVSTLDAEAVAATRRAAEQAAMVLAWRDFVAALREKADIETYPQNL